MKYIFGILLLLVTNLSAITTIYHKDGGSTKGTILEANQTHVTFQRAEDLQQFRFEISELALNSQQAVDLYHRNHRYSGIPKVQTPLDLSLIHI